MFSSKKILIVTRNFPPLTGGMERLNWHLAEELARRAEVRVVAPQGAGKDAPPGVKIIEVPLRPLWFFLLTAGWMTIKESLSFRPSVILAGSGLTAPFALIAAAFSKAKAVAYVHGLDLAVSNVIYRNLWMPCIRKLDFVIANSGATAKLAEKTGVNAEHIAIVHPGVELPDLAPEEHQRRRYAFREEQGLADRPLLLSVGRLTARKGLIPFVREVLPSIARSKPDICMLIIGDAPKNALAAHAETPADILAAAREAGVERNIRLLGACTETVLKSAYLAADVHVFPVREMPNDPEGFGMVAIEAAAHFLPTVAYGTGGVVDAVKEAESGCLVSPGDTTGFAAAVLKLLDKPIPEKRLSTFAAGFAWENFGVQIANALFRDSPDIVKP